MNKLFGGAVVAVAAAASTVVTAPAAAAATVTVEYLCAAPMIVTPKTFDITITAPATATRGVPVTVTATIRSHDTLHVDTPAGRYRGTHRVVLGGAETGDFLIDPVTNPVALDAGERWWLTGSAQVTFDTAGTVTYKPRNIVFSSPGVLGCAPEDASTVPVAATTQVS